MIDVHAPDHTPRGFRDFTIHMLTITLGLLIALGLENGVEALHHRHLRREAEANIREELQNNLKLLQDHADTVVKEQAELGKLLQVLQDASDGKTLPHAKLELAFQETPIPDGAWRTANGTGVLAYMDYGEVEKFAAAYKEQDLLEKAEEFALEDYLQFLPLMREHDGQAVSKAQGDEALPLVRRAYGHVTGMIDIGRGTISGYSDALK